MPTKGSPIHLKDSERHPSSTAGLRFERRLAGPGDPFAEVEWETRDALIGGQEGATVFEQRDVEVPSFWSQTATNVVASKYFRGTLGTPERERSVRQLFHRVVRSIEQWGLDGGVFASATDAENFAADLTHLLLHQTVSFNSPVWFNVGIESRPQCSACFINAVEDTMGSILDLAKTEAMLFKYGSGAGSNLSSLRSSTEALAGGGTASGPVSFMRGYDAFAGVIKSGGKTRRAAKMVILDIDHPDVVDFIACKEREERKAWALIDAGYDGGFNVPGGAYDSVLYQNSNHSVRLSDEFLQAVVDGGEWSTRAVTTGEPMESYPARDLLRQIAEAAWLCGDPGVQYSGTIDAWHTCPNSAPIRASNPCSEFLFIDDTACNLASVNLMKFYPGDGSFDAAGLAYACELLITAQEILVDAAGYPTPAIARNSGDFRPLGLGFANLGALVMAHGLAYDSEAGRHLAGAVAALMTGAAYRQSARLAEALGPFRRFPENREPMLAVLERHREALEAVDTSELPDGLGAAAREAWSEAIGLADAHGLRNSQVTAIAPTGTIGFLMDCDTTGIEPAPALVTYKKLVGGGSMKLVNGTVPEALARLGYSEERIAEIARYVEENDTIEGAPGLEERDLPVFDCAIRAAAGSRSISYSGHLGMLAAVQPFVSGAISKTVNLPRESTVEEVEEVYLAGWRLGLKALAIYRDGSKRSQPLGTAAREAAPAAEAFRSRRRLPDERPAITHRFEVNGHKGYITVGLYEDGAPGEIFLVMAKEGSTISGLMDAFATAISIALQHGVPLETLVDKFTHSRFEPAGFTKNPEIPIAKSITDYIFRWLASKFLDRDRKIAAGLVLRDLPAVADPPPRSAPAETLYREDAPSCQECGCIMVRNGTCYKCDNCGATSGCS